MKKYIKIIAALMMLFSLLMVQEGNVYATEVPVAPEDEKVVYLTFDDGPTKGVTEKILDVLNEKGVKATFFVVGKEIKQREAILQRIYDEGHGIGLHTYSHNYKQVYKNQDIFIQEMEKTLQTINEVLAKDLDIKVIRFPGGSAGRLNKDFLSKLEEHGYRVFDWNVNLEDGVKPTLSPNEIFTNSKKSRDKNNLKIILAHCNANNKTTCQALPQIINYYKEQGFVFKVINNDTEPYYYKFKNKVTKIMSFKH